VAQWKRILTDSDFTDTQITNLQNLVFTSPTVSLTVSPSSFEKGVETDVVYEFTATQNDDTFIASSGEVFTGTNTITNDDLGASGTITVENAVINVTRKFRASFTQQGIKTTANRSSLAYTPQYYGTSSISDWSESSYEFINSTFTKVVQTSGLGTGKLPADTGQFLFSPNQERVHFFSTTQGLTVKDSNGFPQTDFTETQISLKLANNDSQTMYHYMSGEKTLTNFGYELD
tara:strand:+ start:55 stop:750 length:696 start_codon:yes stop_codon:yes gene_type:complete